MRLYAVCQMAGVKTRSKTHKTLEDVEFVECSEFLQGKLPTRKNIIELMLYILRPGKNQVSKNEAASMVASIVEEHLLFCNLYTVRTRHIANVVLKLYD